MTQKDFLAELSRVLNIRHEESQVIYRGFVTALRNSLATGDDVKLEGIGRLVSRLVRSGQGRPISADKKSRLLVEVGFEQYPNSKRDLFLLNPIHEELEGVATPVPTT